MRNRVRATSISLVVTIGLWIPASVLPQARGGTQTRQAPRAQSPRSAQPVQPAQPAPPAPPQHTQPAPAKAPAGWTQKTPDGQPDIQGFWSTATSVPLERPTACGSREFYTEEEMKAGARGCTSEAATTDTADNGAQRGGTKTPADATPHYDLAQFGLNIKTMAESNRTSMIVGPEGRIPPLSPEGQERQAELAAKQAAMRGHEFDQAENRSLTERCILWNSEGPPVLSPGYNSNVQIVQGQGYVMILQEMMHDARLIPLDNRPHVSSNVAQWFGDSRGHWEGDTLVVETTNYNGRNPFQRISSESLKVTERFKRIDEATLQYEFTIEDPVWTKPWTAVVSWAKTDGPLFEYACHEGNYGMVNILLGARAQEREAAAKDR